MQYFKKLIGDRIYLSPKGVSEESIKKYTEWMNDFNVTDYIGRTDQIVTLTGEKEWLENCAKNTDNREFDIVELNSNKLVGTISLGQFSWVNRSSVLGIFIGDKDFRESWVIFQPHTYSRTKNLLDDFARALLSFDHVIVTDIYAAREQNTYNISSLDLVNKIKEYRKEALYMKDFDEIVSYIKSNAKANDIVLTLGAGTVTNIGPEIIKP